MKKTGYPKNLAKTHPTRWEKMTKDEINQFPIRKYNGPVHLIRSEEELSQAVCILKKEKILGFDTETRPAFQKGESFSLALIQLAGEKCVFIFQIQDLGLSVSLLEILSNPDIIKAGVSINFDISELRAVADFEPAGFVELADIAMGMGIQNQGLRGLAAVLLGFRISKGQKTSNWEKRNLAPRQIDYAATDAWVGRELYIKLKSLNA